MFRDKYKDKRYFDEELVFNIETFNEFEDMKSSVKKDKLKSL